MKRIESTAEPVRTATRGRRVDALEWLRTVHRRSELSIPARAVAAVLCARMDPDGASCFPSLATIAADAGYRHGRSVTPHLTELERGGWLIRERRPRKGRDHESTRYYATIPIDAPVARSGSTGDRTRVENGGTVAGHRQGVSADTDNHVTGERHDLDTDLATDHAKELDTRSRPAVDDLSRIDQPQRSSHPSDPESVLADYLDNPWRGGRRLAAIGLEDAQAHELISDAYPSGSREERAAWGGYDSARWDPD